MTLAQQANEAMAQGADPRAVSDRLTHMLRYLRAHPEIAAFGADAVAQGADHNAIAGRVWELAQQEPVEAPETPPRYYGGGEAKAGPLHAALDVFPFATKGMAAIDALGDATKAAVTGRSLTDVAEGKPGGFGQVLSDAYNQNIEARQEALKRYGEEHPVASTVSALTGAIVPVVATLGASAPEQGALLAPKLSTAARIAKGAKAGAAIGALQGVSHAHGGLDDYKRAVLTEGGAGALFGAAAPIAGDAISYAARKVGLPNAASATSRFLASKAPEGSKLRNTFQRLGMSFGDEGAAASEVGKRVAMDEAAGFAPPDMPPSVPGMALDRAGPNLEGLAENIANRGGPGRGVLTKAVTERQAQMRPNVSAAFDQGTGTTATEGEALLRRLADERAMLADRERIANELRASDQASSRVRPEPPNPLNVWRQEAGDRPSAVRRLREMVTARSQEANRLFGEARSATAGQAIDSPTLKRIEQTPIGRQARAWADAQKANRMRPQPTVERAAEMPPELRALGLTDDTWHNSLAKMAERGITPPAGRSETLPDAETLHYMKQYLAKVARLGVRDGQGGKIATEAQGALGLWDRVRSELPDVFRRADEAFAGKSRLIDANNLGRDLMRTGLNPSGSKALYTSLDAVEERVAAMAPEEQEAFRVGAQSAIGSYLRSASRSPKALALQLAEPTSELSRRVVLASGDANLPARLAERLRTPETLVHTVAPPPTMGMIPVESQAAGKGLDVLRHGVSAPSNAPERSLPVLEQRLTGMKLSEQGAFRQGAAQALRGEFAGSTAKSPGRVFGTAGSERARQTNLAFPSSGSARNFQDIINAWDRIQAQSERLSGNSRTATRAAEEAARATPETPGFLRELLRGNPGNAVRALGSAAKKQADEATRQRVDAEIAKILTKPNRTALDEAKLTALFRLQAQTAGRKLLPRTAAMAGTGDDQQP